MSIFGSCGGQFHDLFYQTGGEPSELSSSEAGFLESAEDCLGPNDLAAEVWVKRNGHSYHRRPVKLSEPGRQHATSAWQTTGFLP